MEEGKYIYSIIKEAQDRKFGSIGINDREVSLVHFKDISAVVSSTPIINFDRLDKKELTRNVAIHQKTNEEVMKDCDVVPMAFGIIAPNVDEVSRILEKAYLQFKTALKKVAGKVEFAVQVFWDEKKMLENLTNENIEIKKLKEKAQSPVKGITAKLKLGKLLFETLEEKCREYLKDIENSLKECCLDSKEGKLLKTNSQSTISLEPVMIGNISFLVEKKAEPEFDKKMQELGQKYGENLRFKYVGPMPPYSFVNINLKLGNFEVINEARKLLGLGEKVTFAEIKNAYYALSHQYHPDKYGCESKTGKEMKKIAQAYSILENYCQSCDEFTGKIEGRKYSFREEDVKNSLIIK
ncbi:hypothetical protein COZ62_01190 [Candidatus Berkelbacteria bacterium CG_4_8_14_3_um_filter_39_27]|nr:MAG: hypothetical protein COZ62_01190 [Candidatus Berkelbacteria bacterium CG_4_8_14_3_um_filter_39_27]